MMTLPPTRAALILMMLLLPLTSVSGFQATTTPSDNRADGVKRSYADHAEPGVVDQGTSMSSVTQEVTKRTLYDILGASPMATKEELKKCYVKMAKLSHPDAKLSQNNNSGGGAETQTTTFDFTEIAAAWEVLGDTKMRKRYDRNLQAEEWYKRTQRMTNESLEGAVEILDKVAFPFLRRTTATTLAVGQAVAEGISRVSAKETKETATAEKLAYSLLNVVQAGRQAGRAIDSIELTEKSKELEVRYVLQSSRPGYT
jgi:hypothetical protein